MSASKSFIDKIAYKNTKNGCQDSLNALKKDIKNIEKQIQQLIKEDPELTHLFEIITSVKSISNITATEIIITINEFKDIDDPKKFVSYAGCVLFECSSGKRKGRHKVISIANKKLKSLLHMAAMSL